MTDEELQVLLDRWMRFANGTLPRDELEQLVLVLPRMFEEYVVLRANMIFLREEGLAQKDDLAGAEHWNAKTVEATILGLDRMVRVFARRALSELTQEQAQDEIVQILADVELQIMSAAAEDPVKRTKHTLPN